MSPISKNILIFFGITIVVIGAVWIVTNQGIGSDELKATVLVPDQEAGDGSADTLSECQTICQESCSDFTGSDNTECLTACNGFCDNY